MFLEKQLYELLRDIILSFSTNLIISSLLAKRWKTRPFINLSLSLLFLTLCKVENWKLHDDFMILILMISHSL